MHQQFVCVAIELETESCVGVDFCRDEDQLRFKADMYRRDFGDGYLIIEHPSRNDSIASTAIEVMAMVCERSARDAAHSALSK